jgi:hypothetical protein
MLDKKGTADHLAEQFETYLIEALDFSPKTKRWEGEKTLPNFLRELYAFYRTKLLDTDTLLMVVKGNGEQTPATLVKQMQKVREKWPDELVFVNEAVSSLTRKRMVEQRIPFVIPGNQMYLPMLGVDLREHFRRLRTSRTFFSPSTQVLILDAIYQTKEVTYTTGESAKRFDYSIMTMHRVFDELEQAGLGEHTVRGKERRVRFAGKGKVLWDTALPFMKSPVKKSGYIVASIKKRPKTRSGLSALSEYSNLSPPESEVFAVEPDEWRLIQKDKMIVSTHSSGPGEFGIELWAYPPTRFGRKGIADPLSVYLTLKDSQDERIQAALQDLLKGITW